MQNNISLIRKEIIMDKINSRQFFGTLITACYQNAELRCVLCACSKCAPSHGALGYFIATNQMPCVVAPRRLRISAFCMLHGRSRIALKTQSMCDRGLISTKKTTQTKTKYKKTPQPKEKRTKNKRLNPPKISIFSGQCQGKGEGVRGL